MIRPEAIARALRSSRAWLGASGRHPTSSPRQLLQSMLGIWTCDRALGEDSAELGSLVEIALARLRIPEDLHRVDPKLLLICLQAIEREERASAAIRAFPASIALSISKLSSIPARHAGVAVVLYELGFPGIRLRTLPLAEEPDTDLLLCGGSEIVRQVCGAVAAESHFGAQRIGRRRFVSLRRVLPALLLQTLRSYDLDTGAMLLRTARYLDLPSRGRLDECVSFIMDQQTREGRFGFYAIERAAIRESSDLPDFDDDLSLHLPVTSSCAWALAEVVSGGGVLFMRPGGFMSWPARARFVSTKGENNGPSSCKFLDVR